MQRDLAELAPCGLVYTSILGEILKVNSAFAKMLQWSSEDSGKTKFQDCLTSASRLLYEMHHVPLLSLKGYASELAYELRANGDPLAVSVSSQTHVAADGKLTYCHAIFERGNSSKYERKLIEQKLEAEKALQKQIHFVSVVSHEIKNSLQSMQAANDLLNQRGNAAEQSTYLDILKTSTEALMKVSVDLMQLGQLRNPGLRLQEEDIDLPSMLRYLVNSFKLKALAKSLNLELIVDAKVPSTITVDQTKLQVVLTNLISNAIKYTNVGSIVVSVITLQHSHGVVTLRFLVKDTGIGIPHDKLDSIFEYFQQVDNRAHGFGLGLGIAQEMARMLGSTITVETSDAGSTFSFDVNFKAKKELLLQPIMTASVNKSCRILLAEDNELNVELITKMLTSDSHIVTPVLNGKQAWELVNQETFDIMLVDKNMPEMDGFELLNAVRAADDERIKQLPVIMITGESLEGNSAGTSSIRPSGWLCKPFSLHELRRTISLARSELLATNQPNRFPKVRSICKDNNEYRHVLKKALTMLTDDQINLGHALQKGNSSMIRKIVHKLGSSLTYLGASKLSDDLDELQTKLPIAVDSISMLRYFNESINKSFDQLKLSIMNELEAD